MTNNVDHPRHYHPDSIEAIEVINEWKLNFQTGNALKYISRAGLKNKDKTIEDLEKAIWYLQYEINRLKSNPQRCHSESQAHLSSPLHQYRKPIHSNH